MKVKKCSFVVRSEMEVDGNDEERPGTSAVYGGASDAEEPHAYKVLGHDTFVNLKKIQ